MSVYFGSKLLLRQDDGTLFIIFNCNFSSRLVYFSCVFFLSYSGGKEILQLKQSVPSSLIKLAFYIYI